MPLALPSEELFSDADRPPAIDEVLNLTASRGVGTNEHHWVIASEVADWLTPFLFCSSVPETMTTLYWNKGKWKPYGKDLEKALQSQKARSCSE